jgi:UDP-glucose 4-epimerase
VKRVLVTGGAGFIGSHVVEALVAAGDSVRVLDNFESGSEANLQSVAGRMELMRGDIRDSAALAKAVEGMDTIIHLAAIPSVPQSIEEPLATHEVNYTGTLRVMQAAVEAGVRRVLYASSAAVNAPTLVPPVKEVDDTRPSSPYCIDKLMGEHLLRVFAQVHGIETLALRFFNIYGERQNPGSPYSGVISIFVQRMKSGLPITVYGDGEQTRDFVYVKDLAAVLAELCHRPSLEPGPMNVGTGKRTSLRELIGTLQTILATDAQVNFGPARVGDIEHSFADNGRLLTMVQPAWTPLAEGLTNLVQAG